MILLDTDILSLFWTGHPRVTQRIGAAPESPVISLITRIEVLRGRFDALLKAADARQLHIACERLDATEARLWEYTIVPIDDHVGAVFNTLRPDKKLK